MALALVMATHKLRQYFQAHSIIVLTNKPLRKAMNSTNVAGRMVLWATKLSKFDVQYRLRIAIKAQALVDFMVEFTPIEDGEGMEWGATPWVVNTDSLSNKHAGEVGVILKSPKGDIIECAVRLEFQIMNNKAEYEVFLASLNLARATKVSSMVIRCDSHMITR